MRKETKLEAADGLGGHVSWHRGYLRDILRNGDAQLTTTLSLISPCAKHSVQTTLHPHANAQSASASAFISAFTLTFTSHMPALVPSILVTTLLGCSECLLRPSLRPRFGPLPLSL